MGELILAGSVTPAISTVLAAVDSDPSGLSRRRIDGAPGFIWWPRRSLLEFHVHAAAAQADVDTFRCGSKIHLHAVLPFSSPTALFLEFHINAAASGVDTNALLSGRNADDHTGLI